LTGSFAVLTHQQQLKQTSMNFLTSILVVVILLITNSIAAQNKVISVTVANVTSDQGKVGFALYTKANFMGKPVQGKEGEIKNGKSNVVFENISEGEYSVICYHDKNNNGKMDFSTNRMPLEDYGASNNIMAFAPPTFEGSKFLVSSKDVSINIKF
jgi:uncharacterized protein (DUF2141 family)